MPDRFSKVSNEIYRGGRPSKGDLRLLSDVYDIKTVISLDGKIGGEITDFVKKLGMEHIIIPISGYNSAPLIDYLKNNIASILIDNQPVYIHCRHGSDRTGMAVAFHRMQNQGWSPEKAIEEAKLFDFGDKLSPSVGKLYRSVIMENDDSQADTEDYAMLGQYEEGPISPAFKARQSFAPEMPEEYQSEGLVSTVTEPNSNPILGDPQALTTDNVSSVADEKAIRRRRNLRKVLLETMTETVPQVGGHDGVAPMGGVGPVEGIL